ncbi:class I SAM-dependent methyltransferase [Aegicerativicinus sediminis]
MDLDMEKARGTDKETFETWNNIASMYQDKFMHLDLYNETYDYVCKMIKKPKAKLLDVGCGPGNITKYLLEQRTDFEILGIDIAPNMVNLAQKNNPSAKFLVMDSRNLTELNSTFDGIVAGFCLPYFSPTETKKFISDSSNLLEENGLIYLSFVEGEPSKSGFKSGNAGRVYFYYHQLTVLMDYLVLNDFSDFKVFKVNYKISENEYDIHTIITAKKLA